LSCPQPVILTDRAIAEGHTDLEILVDNEVARENVFPLLSRRGLKADIRQDGSISLFMLPITPFDGKFL